MWEWIRKMSLEARLPVPYTPVCYGGNFVTITTRIVDRLWHGDMVLLELDLERDDNIEEGHFAERSWAGLLSYRLTGEQKKLLEKISSDVIADKDCALVGILQYRHEDKNYELNV